MSRIQLLKNVVDGLHSLADDIQAIADALAGDETAAAEEAAPKYGAPRLSEIDPANYAALMKDAEVLGNAT